MRNQSWVSKTNVTSYLRCPYAFWLTDSGQLDRAELLSPFEAQLAATGIAFERSIVEAAAPVEMPRGGEAELLADDHIILDVRAFRNSKLRLIGRPDGVVTANGALQPIEIKSHRLLQHSDRIELAFYWLLLGYLRTAGTDDPVGWVFLRTQQGSHIRERVELSPKLLAETGELIRAVRRARRDGVEPVWCRCTVCRGARRRQVTEAVRVRRDLSSVCGVGRVRRDALLTAGYATWDDLLAHDSQDIADAVSLALVRPSVSVSEVQRWQAHAQALASNQAIPADGAGPFPVPDSYIAFDAEYTAENVWLLGARAVRPEGDLCFLVWASPEGEAQALSDMNAVLGRFHGLPVVTWNGSGADLPALRKASARAGQRGLLESIAAAHVDMYGWTRQNLMLPIPGLGLKEVSEHFGIARESGVTSGLAAEMLWRQYQRTGDQEIKAEPVGYNLDDLRSLVHAVECLRACATLRSPGPAEALHAVLETVVSEHEPDGPPAFLPGSALTGARLRTSRTPRVSRQTAGSANGRRLRELIFKRRRVS
jgi:predicted RecB family nuclease